jgi:K+-sensing histidine kinase KdpD
MGPDLDRSTLNVRQIGWDVITGSLWTLLAVVVATAVAVGLSSGLEMESVAPVFIVAVVFTATVFGPGYGLLAAAAAVLALDYFLPPEPVAPSLSSAGALVHLVLFVGAALVAGAYAPAARRRVGPARKAFAASVPLASTPETPDLEQMLQLAASEAPAPVRMSGHLVRSLNALVIVFGTAVLVYVLRAYLPSPLVHIAMLASALAAAGLYGVTIGVCVAVFAALTVGVLSASDYPVTHVSGQHALITLSIFVLMSWLVGRLSDRVRAEREALVTMLRNGRDLAATTSEAAVRETLLKALAQATGGGLVRIVDETGQLAQDNFRTNSRQPPASLMLEVQENFTVEGWRSRKLAGDGRDLGVVVWRRGRSSATDPVVQDALVGALVDLGGSAIARARLSAEKAEMEFVARTEQLRTILLDAVSHHFRTPLAGIMGSATSVLNLPADHDPGARRDLLLIIKEQANRLNRYVENFLSVARLESGAIEMKPKPVMLEPFLYDVWESFGEDGGARRFLDAEIDAAPVQADPALLKQVFGNVLENAIKFSPEESVVMVRTRREAGALVVDVADEGCGVPAENRERIFQRFFRAPGARAPGLGLGLYITRSLAEMLGGGVTACERPDGRPGLVLSITLPLAEAA